MRRIERTYDARGGVKDTLSYDAATAGNVLNEVERQYGDFGQLAKEYQEHSGAADGNTLYVECGYDETEVADELTKGLRPASVRYPNGRLVHYTYGSSGGAADNLGRLEAIKDDSAGSPGATVASYSYLGLSTVVIEDYEGPDLKLDLWGGTSGTYQGFDRFGRVVDHSIIFELNVPSYRLERAKRTDGTSRTTLPKEKK